MCVTLFSVSVILLATVAVEVDFAELWDIVRGFKWQSIHVITHLSTWDQNYLIYIIETILLRHNIRIYCLVESI